MKKADKCCKGCIKASGLKFSKFDDFFNVNRLIRCPLLTDLCSFEFQGQKGQKGRSCSLKSQHDFALFF